MRRASFRGCVRSSTGILPVKTDELQGQDGPATHGQDAHATTSHLLTHPLTLYVLIGIVLSASCKPGNTLVTSEPAASSTKLTAKDAGSTVNIREGGTLEIALEGNYTTGYMWQAAPDSGTLLAQQGEGQFKPASSALGSGGIITLRFKAVQHGEAQFKLIYHRTFEPNVPPLRTFEIRLVVAK